MTSSWQTSSVRLKKILGAFSYFLRVGMKRFFCGSYGSPGTMFDVD